MAPAKKTAAKKKPVTAPAPPQKRRGRPVRLDLTEPEHEHLQSAAEKLGLSKASYARQATLERIRQDETKG